MALSNHITPGMTLSISGKLYRVESSVKVTVAKGTPFIKTKLKDLTSQELVEKNFKLNQTINDVSLVERRLEFLYPEGNDYLFLDIDNLDQVLVPSEGLRRVLSIPMVLTSSSKMRTAMKQLSVDFGGRQFGRAHVLRALTAMLIGLVAREMATKTFVPDVKTNMELFEHFEALLEEHYREHWNVSRYAAALSITPTHLSRITRLVTGHGASQLIIDRIIREGRRNLVYTNLSISMIAYSLGFRDPAYFSRLFSEATGLAPREFRSKFLLLAPSRNAGHSGFNEYTA